MASIPHSRGITSSRGTCDAAVRQATCLEWWPARPPGAGKTTLAATWIEARRRPGIWYQLDAGDSDPATFFYYLRQAAEAAGAGGESPLPLLTSEYLADVPGFARRWFRELFARLPAGAALALDNYQDVASESVLHAALASACRELPQGAQLLVMSWIDPPAELSPLVADERLARIEPDALKLGLDEARGIAAEKDARGAEQVSELHRQCDGWAAGFTLLRERLRRTGLVNRTDQHGSMQGVFDYFMAQVFKDAPPETRETLVKTAFFPRFTEAMAVEVSGDGRAGELLDRLYRRHLFLDRRYGADVTYQYHMLFRAFLLEEARRRYTPVGLAELAARAAAALERVGLIEDALQLLLEGGDADGAARLVEKLAPELVASGRGASLGAWLEKLPVAQRDRRPWLSYWLGAGITGVDLRRARAGFERAHEGFVRYGDRVGQVLAVVGVLHTHFLELDDFHRIEPWLRVLEPLVAEEPLFPSAESAASVYGTLVGLMTWEAPRHPLYSTCVERLDALVSGPLQPNVKVTAASHLVEHYGFGGWIARGKRVIAEVERLVRGPAVTPLARASWWVRRCRVDYQAGDFETLRRNLEQALAVARENSFHFLLTLIHGLRADAALTCEELAAVPPILDEMQRSLPLEGQHAVGRVHWVRARLAALRGDLEEALRECEACCSVVEENGLALAQVAYYSDLASIQLERGEPERARAALDRCRGITSPEMLPYVAFKVQALAAVIDATSSSAMDWRPALRDGLRRLRELEVVVPVGVNPLLARQLAETALAEHIEPAYVRAWIRKVGMRPSSPDVPNWPWPVRIRTLGGFAVELDDAPLAFPGKVPRKPLELLQALVASGGRPVATEVLAEALWPDSEGDAAESALRMALSRLRKILRRNDAVVLHDGKLSLDDGVCWIDARSLERLCSEVEARPRPEQAQSLLELYRGPFLERAREQPWMLAARDELRRRFARAVSRLRETLEREGRTEEALALREKAFEQDRHAEVISRQILVAGRSR